MASLEEDMVLDGEENVGSEELLDKEIADVSVEGQSSSGEGAQSGRSLNITVKCQTLEGLEKLWQDYSSGHLNSVAEELLVTDDIKKKLGVESIKLKTVITEESYLACKRYLLNKLDASSDQSSSSTPSLENMQEASSGQQLMLLLGEPSPQSLPSQGSVNQDEEKMN